MNVTIIPILIGAFGTVTKGLLKGLEDLEVGGRVETIQLQYYWEQPEYWEESWGHKETCCHLNTSEKPLAKTDMKNSQGVNNNDFQIRTDYQIPYKTPEKKEITF